MVIVNLIYKDPASLKIADHDIKLDDLSVMNRSANTKVVTVRMNCGYTFNVPLEIAMKLGDAWNKYCKGEITNGSIIEVKEENEPKPVRNLIPSE
jgi:hypothetical protein